MISENIWQSSRFILLLLCMICSAIVAVAENGAIGKKNGLPWHLPADLKYFKAITLGKPVIMGRKTFESLGRPLPGRLNVVLSGSPDLVLPEGVRLSNDLNATLESLELENIPEIFVIGGGKIFEIAMSEIDYLYVTRVKTIVEDADVFFPDIDHTHWKLVWEEEHEPDSHNHFAYTFQKFERIDL